MIEIGYLAKSHWRPDEYADLVTPDERARAQRFHFPQDAGRFLASRALSRVLLARRLDVAPDQVVFDRRCAHCGDPRHGKPTVGNPTVSNPSVHFSLTRAGPVVAVALGPSPLGLDAEPDRPGLEDLIEVFSERERAWIARGETRALWLWVAKEAVGKASGLGLERADQIHIPFPANGWQRATDAQGYDHWLTHVEIPGTAAAAVSTIQDREPPPMAPPRSVDLRAE